MVRDTCAERGARMVRAADVVRMTARGDGAIDVATGPRRLDGVTLALSGGHQQENAAVAVALLDELARSGIAVPDGAVRAGLSRAVWPARLERFQVDGTDILLDAAHNPAGARALAAYLAEIGWTEVTLLFGALQDKDVRRMLEPLAPLCAAIVCTTAPTPRAFAAEELAAHRLGGHGGAGRRRSGRRSGRRAGTRTARQGAHRRGRFHLSDRSPA